MVAHRQLTVPATDGRAELEGIEFMADSMLSDQEGSPRRPPDLRRTDYSLIKLTNAGAAPEIRGHKHTLLRLRESLVA
jgi:hypothetical protein